jgi:hypothetical protein
MCTRLEQKMKNRAAQYCSTQQQCNNVLASQLSVYGKYPKWLAETAKRRCP